MMPIAWEGIILRICIVPETPMSGPAEQTFPLSLFYKPQANVSRR